MPPCAPADAPLDLDAGLGPPAEGAPGFAEYADAVRERAGHADDEFLARVAALAAEEQAKVLERIEAPKRLILALLRTPAEHLEGYTPEGHRRAIVAGVDAALHDLFDMSPSDRLELLTQLPKRERQVLHSAYPGLFEGVSREATADSYRMQAEALERLVNRAKERGRDSETTRQMTEQARAMASAKRRAAAAIETKADPSVEMRESRRTTRRCLNRARRHVGLKPLPVPPRLRLVEPPTHVVNS
jgi:hypothetical protein